MFNFLQEFKTQKYPKFIAQPESSKYRESVSDRISFYPYWVPAWKQFLDIRFRVKTTILSDIQLAKRLVITWAQLGGEGDTWDASPHFFR